MLWIKLGISYSIRIKINQSVDEKVMNYNRDGYVFIITLLAWEHRLFTKLLSLDDGAFVITASSVP